MPERRNGLVEAPWCRRQALVQPASYAGCPQPVRHPGCPMQPASAPRPRAITQSAIGVVLGIVVPQHVPPRLDSRSGGQRGANHAGLRCVSNKPWRPGRRAASGSPAHGPVLGGQIGIGRSPRATVPPTADPGLHTDNSPSLAEGRAAVRRRARDRCRSR
jgi:hypothetical protein